MSTQYDNAPAEIMAVLDEQMRLHHPDLVECGAVIGVLIATNEKGPAVKHHGSAALATIQAITQKHRVKKKIDAEMVIDWSEWNQLLPDQQAALIGHELSHLKRVEHKAGALAKLRRDNPDQPSWKIEPDGRPKLKTIEADISPGDGFHSCVVIYGKSAVEFVTAKRFAAFAEAAMKEREEQEVSPDTIREAS